MFIEHINLVRLLSAYGKDEGTKEQWFGAGKAELILDCFLNVAGMIWHNLTIVGWNLQEITPVWCLIENKPHVITAIRRKPRQFLRKNIMIMDEERDKLFAWSRHRILAVVALVVSTETKPILGCLGVEFRKVWVPEVCILLVWWV